MPAVRTARPASFTPPPANLRADAVVVLGEVVAQLAERVELLEIRESIARTVVDTLQSRHRPNA